MTEPSRELEFMRKRDDLLTEIDAATRVATDAAEITHIAASLLGRHLHVNRCIYVEIEDDQDKLTVIGNFVDGLPSIVGSYNAPPVLQF